VYKEEVVFFGTFKEKLNDKNRIDITNNIYREPEFAEYYEAVANEPISGDIEFYLNTFSKDDRVLEIGTGNGRILKPLLQHEIDVYGIEPEQAMLGFLSEEEKSRVYVGGIENIAQFNHSSKYTYIIIPATSVSLFDEQCFSTFLYEAKKVLASKGKIIFDFINPDQIEKLNGAISVEKIKNQLFMSGNFVQGDKFIYNIYTRTAAGNKKLGYSIKNIYTIDQVNRLSERFGYTTNIIKHQSNYVMMEVQKNEI
jgi:SAM-dependent methyltransferase